MNMNRNGKCDKGHLSYFFSFLKLHVHVKK